MASPAHAHRRRSHLPLAMMAAAASVIVVTAGAFGWAAANDDDPAGATQAAPTPTGATTASGISTPEPSPEPTTPEPPPTVEFTLVTGGDVLTHGPVLTSARAAGDGEYNFAPLMEGVRPYVEGADLALCHLEVPIAPPGVAPSGYPRFGAPGELVTALAQEGWDGCTTASNHSVDRGRKGLTATLEALDMAGMGHAGMARTEAEAASTQMYTVSQGERQVQVANISYTYGLNGLPKPEGMPWAVNTFDANAQDVTPIIDAAQLARDQGADIVVASTHCCIEYQTEPNPAQRDIVEQIAESGLVDLYVGHHAHVPQPIELIPGGVSGDGMWAYFGHGNFLSNQGAHCCRPVTNSGYLGVTTFTVPPEGNVDVAVEWVATTVDRRDGHTMHTLEDIVDSGAGQLTAAEAKTRLGRVAEAVGEQAPASTAPPVKLAETVFAVDREGP